MTTDYRLSHKLPLGDLDSTYSEKSWKRVKTPAKAHAHSEALGREFRTTIDRLRENPTIGQLDYYRALMSDFNDVTLQHRAHKDSPLAFRVRSRYEPADTIGDVDTFAAVDHVYHDPIPSLDRPNEFENLKARAYQTAQEEASQVRTGWG
jgi:hypothetical protein